LFKKKTSMPDSSKQLAISTMDATVVFNSSQRDGALSPSLSWLLGTPGRFMLPESSAMMTIS